MVGLGTLKSQNSMLRHEDRDDPRAVTPNGHGSSASEGGGKIGCRLVQEPVDETRESVSIGELAVTPGARDAAALENDEFDDLLLEVIVFGQA
jgi:hypothetical protein